jgi:hypothetical protein
LPSHIRRWTGTVGIDLAAWSKSQTNRRAGESEIDLPRIETSRVI